MALFTLSQVGPQAPVRVPVPEVAQLSIGIKPTMTGKERDHGARYKTLFLLFEQGSHILILH